MNPLQERLNYIQRRALVVGAVGLLLCVLGALISREQFFQSWLLGFVFWVGLGLGSLGIALLHHLTGGGWGLGIRRIVESGAMTLPLMALLFVPLLFGLQSLYVWTQPEAVAADKLLQHKALYLNTSFFLGRTVLYFVIWIGMALVLTRWSLRQDNVDDPALDRRIRFFGALGLIVFVATVSFAFIDWLMSLEPHFVSTMYGLFFVVGQGLAALAFAIGALALLHRYQPLSDFIRPSHFNDLGSLMLAFVMIWAYFGFSQFLIVWSGNLPDEVFWYLNRTQGGWQFVGLFLILFHFALPFALLLSRELKRNVRVLAVVAAGIILVRLVDLIWHVAPAFHRTGLGLHWLDLAAVVGIGGLWVAVFVWQLKGRSLLPQGDPRLPVLSASGSREASEHG